MAALGRARELLGEDGERVLGALVTVDPARDTVAQLAAYLSRFPPGLIGLTGSPEALAEVARGYLVTAAPSAPAPTSGAEHAAHAPAADAAAHAGHGPSEAGNGMAGDPATYTMDHTGRAYVVHDDALRMTFPPMTDAAQMAAGLKLLLDP
jgi:protein SCO1/2